MAKFDFAIAIGGAAGQGIATPGNILARICARRGLQFFSYNSYQSIIRGGHIFLTTRISTEPVTSHGDKIDLLFCLNQDTMDRHLQHVAPGGTAIFNSDTIKPGEASEGLQLCPMPVKELSNNNRNKLVQNTVALAGVLHLLGLEFKLLEDILTLQFKRKGQAVVDENVDVARAAYEYSVENFVPYSTPLPQKDKPLAQVGGNEALAMGGAAAGVNFYCAYPMSPSTGVLHWMAENANDLGIMVRQVEDEIGVINMVIGAAHAGCRAMCATSGGGFALMTEAVGSAGMMEIPMVAINVQRAGPSTGVPTKTEQGDLWQMLGASQGDFPKIIVAVTGILDCFNTIPELFNLVDKFQCPGLVITDLSVSEGYATVDPDDINWEQPIDRGELIAEPDNDGEKYLRYRFTESGISPRAVPGTPGHLHVVATDEHDEDGGLISDEFTNPHIRRAMVEKRQRKMESVVSLIDPPELEGPENAEVTLIGWGTSKGVIEEAAGILTRDGIPTNQLAIKWIVPLHVDEILQALSTAKRTIIVESNYTGQFARYLRGETGFDADGHIRKYDGEPFMPHHIVDGVKEQVAGKTDLYVPYQEIVV
ncbi:MAG: 2-oxoacid:acceptor oxidoreductase subunit alpha [Candidatus Poribacteria bacterium]|nr:2-oxoacid:acceptor oxidoreductase subunit alpha [Candidatus Poribacteria bacterium]